MSLSIYNTLAREKQLFEPLHPGRVHMYVCGPTVYNDAHLGHGKTYVNFDTMVRYLRYLGYQVLYVQNITDVGHMLDSGEDRMLQGAKREQMQPMQLAEYYTRRYFARHGPPQRVATRYLAARHRPRPRDDRLDRGAGARRARLCEPMARSTFDVSRFEAYGKLSGRRLEEAQSGTRVQQAG